MEEASGSRRSDGGWSVVVSRNLIDWEVKEYENLLLLLSKVKSQD